MKRQEQIEQAKAELFPIGDNGRSYEQALGASGFDLGVKWADEHPKGRLVDIDKACEWLEYHANDFMMTSHETLEDWRERKKILFNNFRKAMEE